MSERLDQLFKQLLAGRKLEPNVWYHMMLTKDGEVRLTDVTPSAMEERRRLRSHWNRP